MFEDILFIELDNLIRVLVQHWEHDLLTVYDLSCFALELVQDLEEAKILFMLLRLELKVNDGVQLLDVTYELLYVQDHAQNISLYLSSCLALPTYSIHHIFPVYHNLGDYTGSVIQYLQS